MKRDAIELHHCLIQYSPFDVRNFFSVLAMPLATMTNLNTENVHVASLVVMLSRK